MIWKYRTATTLCLLLLGATRALSQETPIPPPPGIEPAIPPAYPLPDGHIVLTQRHSTVFVTPREYVLLRPPHLPYRPDFVVRTLYLLDGDRLIEQRHLDPGEPFGLFLVKAPEYGQTLRRMRVIALNDFSEPVELMACQIRSFPAGPELRATAEPHNEQLLLRVERRNELRDIYLFVNQHCIGRWSPATREVRIDLRALPPGTHHIALMATQETGMLLPLFSRTVSIQPRYEIHVLEPPGEVRIPEDAPDRTLAVAIRRTGNTGITRTLVYIAGQFIAESDRPEFLMELPLRDVPTGNVTIEALGMAADRSLYPPETHTLAIRNLPWEERMRNRPEWEQLATLNAQIQTCEAEAIYWYHRALRNPAFRAANNPDIVQPLRAFRTSIQFPYLERLQAPGLSREFCARASRAVLQMAQARLATGRIYRALRMWEKARTAFRRALREAGEDTPTGLDAREELQALDLALKRRH
ncbi:MAG: hypothetical protein RMJ43_05680 [Chloroherpetonaceae bacterium]|nr:hypothetical protein [Chthonomonadaceae bacterium]MDW8207306.1 hypothetical protein [Chloroherpetonaceae bacterium]